MNQEHQTPTEPRLSIAGLRKMRAFYLQSLAEYADQIKAIDCEIEALNMANIGDDGFEQRN